MNYMKKIVFLSMILGTAYSCKMTFHPQLDCYEDAKNVIYDIIYSYQDIMNHNTTLLPNDFENLICDVLELFKECFEEKSILMSF